MFTEYITISQYVFLKLYHLIPKNKLFCGVVVGIYKEINNLHSNNRVVNLQNDDVIDEFILHMAYFEMTSLLHLISIPFSSLLNEGPGEAHVITKPELWCYSRFANIYINFENNITEWRRQKKKQIKIRNLNYSLDVAIDTKNLANTYELVKLTRNQTREYGSIIFRPGGRGEISKIFKYRCLYRDDAFDWGDNEVRIPEGIIKNKLVRSMWGNILQRWWEKLGTNEM